MRNFFPIPFAALLGQPGPLLIVVLGVLSSTLQAAAASQLVSLVQGGQVDVFLNLCDGGWDEDRAGKEVVEALER